MVTSPASVDVDVVYEPPVTFTFATGFFGAAFFAACFFGSDFLAACFLGAAFFAVVFLAACFFGSAFFFGVVFFDAMTVDTSRDCWDRGGSSLAARGVWATLWE